MPIVTLITDLGKDTHVIAKAKAKLLMAIPQTTIIDISHAVTPFLLDEAVYFAQSSVNDFAEGTTHIISVDADIKKYKRVLVAKYKGQFFVTVDNGFIAMLTKGERCEVFEVDHRDINYNTLSPLKSLLIPIVKKITEQGIENTGRQVDDWLEKTLEQPVILENSIRGKVLYINNYNNAITNISHALFDNERVGRRFRVVLNRFDSISVLSESYNDVNIGDNLCFFNSEGLLEIAINRGNASQLLGLEKDKRVTVEFFTERSTSEIQSGGLL